MTARVLAALLVSAAVADNATQNVRRPNFFILADDLGYADLSCYGQRNFNTPHLDQLASEGLRFTQHYAGSTVRAPSRACQAVLMQCEGEKIVLFPAWSLRAMLR